MPIAKADRQSEAIESLVAVIKELKEAVETLSGEVETLSCRVSDIGTDLGYLEELPRVIDYLGNQLWRQNGQQHLPLDSTNKKRK